MAMICRMPVRAESIGETNMNPAAHLSRDAAVRTIGSVWCIDHHERTIFENLGITKPAYCTGNAFRTLEEADAAAGDRGYRICQLPERIRLPAGTPVALDAGMGKRAGSAMWLVRIDNFSAKGMRLERREASFVSFRPAPVHLQGHYDFIASAAILDGQEQLKILLSCSPEGFPFITSRPMLLLECGWTESNRMKAFMSYKAAVEQAESFRRKILAALDWEKDSAAAA